MLQPLRGRPTLVKFDQKTESTLRRALRSSFPDTPITEADLLALALCVQQQQAEETQLTLAARPTSEALPPELSQLDLSPYGAELQRYRAQLPEMEQQVRTRPPGDTYRYYSVRALHTRKTPDGFEPFTGELSMVRVSLPARTPQKFSTCMGSVEPGDHLISTVHEANQKYQSHLGYTLSRVDCIAPARQTVRFGAVSVYLGYRGAQDPLPVCYILEAGTATGEPKVLYLGKHLGATINAYTGYQPSPFACPSHAYLGRLTLRGDHPHLLTISSRAIRDQKSLPPYIQVDIEFTEQKDSISSTWPGFLITRAAAIVLSRKLTGKIPEDCDPRIPGAR